MSTLLYLDTARMGLMCERTRLAQIDYLRLAADEGCSLYFEQLLTQGFPQWSPHLRHEYPQLQAWQGIAKLKRRLAKAAGKPEATVLLANRSAQLMKLGASELAKRSRCILVSDLTWPSYRRILEHERLRTRTGLTTVPLREDILAGRLSVTEAVTRIATQYAQRQCDGVFLPAVSHDGIRLPLDAVLAAIQQVRKPRFVVVDGAQAYCHVPDQLGLEHCDLFIAGCHKWMGAHFPMGLALLPTDAGLGPAANRMLRSGELDDPLLAFTEQLETGTRESFTETVSLVCLFSTAAALAERSLSPAATKASFTQRYRNRGQLAATLSGSDWEPLVPQQAFRSGSLLVCQASPPRSFNADELRSHLRSRGISATAYDNGLVRLAMPDRPWQVGELELIRAALREYALVEVAGPDAESLIKSPTRGKLAACPHPWQVSVATGDASIPPAPTGSSGENSPWPAFSPTPGS